MCCQGCLAIMEGGAEERDWFDLVAAEIGMSSLWTHESREGWAQGHLLVDLYTTPQAFEHKACKSELYSVTVNRTPNGPELVYDDGITRIRLLALRGCEGVQLSDFNFVFDSLEFNAVLEALSYLSSILECSTKACFDRLDVSFESGVSATSLPEPEETVNWEARSGTDNSIRLTLMRAVGRGELLAIEITPTSSDGKSFSGQFYTEYFHIVDAS